MDESVDVFQDLVVEMMAHKELRPQLIAIFADDPIRNNGQLVQLIESFSKLVVVSASTASLAKATPSLKGASPTQGSSQYVNLGVLSHLVSLVNEHLVPASAKTEWHRLLDLLFSPSLPNWDPYAHDLDFPRTATAELTADIRTLLTTSPFEPQAVVLRGGVASGKSVVLKRIAFDLAKSNRLVVWLRSAMYPDNNQILTDIFKAFQRMKPPQRIVVVMDDPASFVALSPRDVVAAARAASLDIILLVGVRTSEWTVHDTAQFVGPLRVAIEHELPDAFDDAEWLTLPDYFVKLRLYANRSLAETALRGVQHKSTTDTLSTLYWLLPEVRAAIAQSVKDEYFRLGDVGGLSKVLIGAVNKTSKILKDAYELVAVANHYRASLPIEVLVAALGVPYSEWLDATPDGAAWGLLYPDADPRDEGAAYRTRSDVVTRIIVNTVNGGAGSQGGELRLLAQLLKACGGTNPLYREFCIKILVNNEPFDRLDYDDGLHLFEAALEALPYEDKTLLHHKALWIKKKGRNPLQAVKVFEKALAAPQYPYASQHEPDEHIHNSVAATYIDLIEQNLIEVNAGKTAVLEHLSRARSTQFFNTFTAHVQANMILHLMNLMKADDIVDIASLSARALGDVDMTLKTVRHDAATTAASSDDDIEMLRTVRTKLLSKLKPIPELKADATKQWEQFKSQNGFIVVARKLLDVAQMSGKGSDYQDAYSYVEGAMDTVRSADVQPSAGLAEVAVQIYYTWRVARRIPTKNAPNVIDWEKIRELSALALHSRRGGPDSYNQYLHAVALAQLGRWTDANAVFNGLRQNRLPSSVLWLGRDLLLDANGTPMRVQGTIRTAGDRVYLHTDLGTDFRADRNESWPRSGEITHANIQFAFGGATAIPPRV